MSFIEARQRVTDTSGILLLLEMTAPSFGATLRLVNDTQDWVSNSETYVGFPFRFKLPDDTQGVSPRAVLEIDNVGREMTADLETLQPNEIVTATIRIADKSEPNDIFQTLVLPMTSVSVTPTVATAQCGVDYIMRQASVRIRATPFILQGIF
ncbi:hypothetical protein CSC70_06330 [Pseudoxanthomonas kalamensis DSM 18571]|uniref:DUF1833 family protein n=1 Tax=Pseudoxanthomonas kalamensis TaxID=289483 RepID=UPI001391DC4F|nr:DUF1833 family protein [Pseudoxanthomonas kalamensis]KAF1710307.1 hypothetical protein CSC70_06330 [Pseudoxanthomonas kalamensis DSM 18571]